MGMTTDHLFTDRFEDIIHDKFIKGTTDGLMKNDLKEQVLSLQGQGGDGEEGGEGGGNTPSGILRRGGDSVGGVTDSLAARRRTENGGFSSTGGSSASSHSGSPSFRGNSSPVRGGGASLSVGAGGNGASVTIGTRSGRLRGKETD